MKKFVEKQIERLEEYQHSHLIERNSEQMQHCKEEGPCGNRNCILCIWNKAKEIVKQFATKIPLEEYQGQNTIDVGELFGKNEQVNDGWIACSERLPKDCTIYEVTAQFGNKMCYTEFAYYDESRGEWWKHDDDGLVNVLAWKEHSAPYQPKGEQVI